MRKKGVTKKSFAGRIIAVILVLLMICTTLAPSFVNAASPTTSQDDGEWTIVDETSNVETNDGQTDDADSEQSKNLESGSWSSLRLRIPKNIILVFPYFGNSM